MKGWFLLFSARFSGANIVTLMLFPDIFLALSDIWDKTNNHNTEFVKYLAYPSKSSSFKLTKARTGPDGLVLSSFVIDHTAPSAGRVTNISYRLIWCPARTQLP